ncbi:MAG: sulfite dehydrogenase [Gammaproteobacteria bacterium]
MPTKSPSLSLRDLQPAAGNGLLDRRAFFKGGAALAAAMSGYTLSEWAAAQPLVNAASGSMPGAPTKPYGTPSRFETAAVRTETNPNGEFRTGQARTPHHVLNGTVTPGGLHFVVAHTGTPDINPDEHRLLIHGLVDRPLVFTLDALMRYPMETRMAFLECGGNSAGMFFSEPAQDTVQALHGQVSNSEWTGVMLSTLLEETGIDPRAKWFIGEGADAIALTRSVPLHKGLDDAMIALYQNGERIMPNNGYPMKLLLPGWEGNMNVKWLRRIELTDQPGMTFYETRVYADVMPDASVLNFYFIQEVKSFITHPSPGWTMSGPGFYEISGLAYSGNGRISRVMVSADGGESWAEAALQEPVLPKAFTRFRAPWRWDGGPAVLQSRAWDEAGEVQPAREDIIAWRGQHTGTPRAHSFPSHHYNGPTSWAVDSDGEVKHVYV